MKTPELVFVSGCNAAGKSSFIRTRLNELPTFEIIMPDVYKGRTKEIFYAALNQGKDILLETVFNDESFKDLVDQARNAGYKTSLVALFLNSPDQSLKRVVLCSLEQSGLNISKGNVNLNFMESFKNIAKYYFYFDWADFIYTGNANQNLNVMTFKKSTLVRYQKNDFPFIRKFADYSFHNDRLNQHDYNIILNNEDYIFPSESIDEQSRKFNL
jgi:predicted ABC-type ATPase